jgi:hypothetical protein
MMTNDFGAFNPFEETENTENDSVEKSEVSFEDDIHQQEVEEADKEKLEEIEDEFKELDSELLDIDEGEDTAWLIQKVIIGILKIAGILGIIVFVFWSIWGGVPDPSEKKSSDKKIEKVEKKKESIVKKNQNPAKKILIEKKEVSKKAAKDKEGFFDKLFSKSKKKEGTQSEIPAVKNQKRTTKTTKEFNKNKLHNASIEIMAWNYWTEQNRVLEQDASLGKAMLLKKDMESLFDVSLYDQVKGKNDITRERNVNKLINEIVGLLERAEVLQNKLLREIYEFSEKEKLYIKEAIKYERKFLNAMKQSDPSGIGGFLKEKISAEKKQTESGIEAESRKILFNKLDSYAEVLQDLHQYLIANKKALIKDVQVVDFENDPFHRVLSIDEWLNMPQN